MGSGQCSPRWRCSLSKTREHGHCTKYLPSRPGGANFLSHLIKWGPFMCPVVTLSRGCLILCNHMMENPLSNCYPCWVCSHVPGAPMLAMSIDHSLLPARMQASLWLFCTLKASTPLFWLYCHPGLWGGLIYHQHHSGWQHTVHDQRPWHFNTTPLPFTSIPITPHVH